MEKHNSHDQEEFLLFRPGSYFIFGTHTEENVRLHCENIQCGKLFFLFLPTDLTYQLSKVASKPNLQKLPSLKIKIRSLVLHISCKTFTQTQCLKTTKKASFYNIASEASYVNAKILWYHKCK